VREPGVVYVVDDDEGLRAAVADLLRGHGLVVKTFADTQSFLSEPPIDEPACLVLDVHLPDGTGLELQRTLAEQRRHLPIVFMTGQGDVPTSVRAMKAGALEFLLKPFQDDELLGAVEQALSDARSRHQTLARGAELRARYELLTRREREVFHHVVAGLLNKQIAYELGISEVTVKIHRGQAMHKMAASSVADLVRMAEELQPMFSELESLRRP
jgi:FixJ family two-component response regulator